MFQTTNQSNNKYLGKLEYFTHLNLAAIKGDDSPEMNQWFPGFGRSEVVIYNLPRNIYHIAIYPLVNSHHCGMIHHGFSWEFDHELSTGPWLQVRYKCNSHYQPTENLMMLTSSGSLHQNVVDFFSKTMGFVHQGTSRISPKPLVPSQIIGIHHHKSWKNHRTIYK